MIRINFSKAGSSKIWLLALAGVLCGQHGSWGQRPFYLVPGVHPGYSIVSMRPSSMTTSGATAAPNTGGMAWLPDGRLFIASMSSNAAGGNDANRLGISNGYMFTGIPAASSNASVTVSQVSTGYQMPTGAVAVGDSIYVVDNQDGLTKLTPAGGGTYTKSVLYKGVLGYNSGLSGSGYRTWVGGLLYKSGFFYATVGMGLIPGGVSEFTTANIYRGKGCVWKVSQNGAVADSFACGIRNPVGLAWSPDSEMMYTDNQGSFEPASAMYHVRQGRFFGHPKTPFDNQLRTAPAIIFPYGSNPTGGTATNPTVARVATDMLTLKDGRFKNQMLVGVDHTTGLNRVFLEKIPVGTSGDFVYQGALFPFSQGFGVGTGNNSAAAIAGVLPDFRTNVHSLSYGPDGYVYLGGGNSPGTESQGSHGFVGGLQYGLVRLVPKDTTVFEMKAIRSKSSNQMEIEFTEPIVSAATSNFTVRQWGCLQGGSANDQSYGAGYQLPGVSTLNVSDVTLNSDKTRATLTISGLIQRPTVTTPNSVEDRTWGSTVQFNVTGIAAVSGHSMWGDGTGGGVAWYTLNKFGPGVDAGTSATALVPRNRDGSQGLSVRWKGDGLSVALPDPGAYVLRVLEASGRTLSSVNVNNQNEFVMSASTLGHGMRWIEVSNAAGQKWISSVARP
ncbi:MAG TPA: hypothetical protein DCQ83_06685 [Fibrobacteres bacterium]|nr:hypothetical protein [Fibrobacterota bacterium]